MCSQGKRIGTEFLIGQLSGLSFVIDWRVVSICHVLTRPCQKIKQPMASAPIPREARTRAPANKPEISLSRGTGKGGKERTDSFQIVPKCNLINGAGFNWIGQSRAGLRVFFYVCLCVFQCVCVSESIPHWMPGPPSSQKKKLDQG